MAGHSPPYQRAEGDLAGQLPFLELSAQGILRSRIFGSRGQSTPPPVEVVDAASMLASQIFGSHTKAPLSPILSSYFNALGADVALNNTATFFDGPKVTQGVGGVWFVTGHVTITDTVNNTNFYLRLWDGTTVIASAKDYIAGNAGNDTTVISLSGIAISPVGDLRISVRDLGATTGKILFNSTGDSKDSCITALRIG